MAARDAQLFLRFLKILILWSQLRKAGRAIPTGFNVDGYYITRKSIVRYFRYMLQGFRGISDDEEFINKLLAEQNTNPFIRMLLNSHSPEILTSEMQNEIDKVRYLAPSVQEEVHEEILNKLEGLTREVKPQAEEIVKKEDETLKGPENLAADKLKESKVIGSTPEELEKIKRPSKQIEQVTVAQFPQINKNPDISINKSLFHRIPLINLVNRVRGSPQEISGNKLILDKELPKQLKPTPTSSNNKVINLPGNITQVVASVGKELFKTPIKLGEKLTNLTVRERYYYVTTRETPSSGNNNGVNIWWIVFGVGIFLALAFLNSGNTNLNNPSLGNGSCPTQAVIDDNKKDRTSCHFLKPNINIFDTGISSDSIQRYIDKYSPIFIKNGVGDLAEFQRRVNLIISKSKEAGLNPVLLLAYWKTESYFSTYKNASDLGCAPGVAAMQTFEKQVDCALGTIPGANRGSQCAISKKADSSACLELKGIRESTVTHDGQSYPNNQIYANFPINYPVTTFDDFIEAYGSISPLLDNNTNNNCISTYNMMIEVAKELNACSDKPSILAGVGDMSQCKFTKGDESISFQSQKLLGYFKEVEQKTGVPASLLAGVARIESTTESYSISNYTDSDISAMENTGQIVGDIDKTIGDSSKAICPRSLVGALGIMQIQPQQSIHDAIRAETLQKYGKEQDPNKDISYNRKAAIPPFSSVGAYDRESVNLGSTKYLGKSAESLTVQDYCDPKSSIYIAAGFILNKLSQNINGVSYSYGDGLKWDPSWNNNPDVINTLAQRYYGGLYYGSNNQYSYGDNLYKGIQSCIVNTNATKPAGPDVPSSEFGKYIASFANQIASELVSNASDGQPELAAAMMCAPGTESFQSGPSYHCWKDAPDYNQVDGEADLRYLQCTEYVWAVFDRAGFRKEIDLIRHSNAEDWYNAARADNHGIFNTFTDPTQLAPGDIISLGTPGVLGHVAVVIERGLDVNGKSYVRVGQASTAKKYENYTIDLAQHRLFAAEENPDRPSRIVQGFIRLVKRL